MPCDYHKDLSLTDSVATSVVSLYWRRWLWVGAVRIGRLVWASQCPEGSTLVCRFRTASPRDDGHESRWNPVCLRQIWKFLMDQSDARHRGGSWCYPASEGNPLMRPFSQVLLMFPLAIL